MIGLTSTASPYHHYSFSLYQTDTFEIDNPKMSVEGEKYVLYHYNPSLAAAAVFAALFGISTVLHVAQLGLRRTWYFIPFLIGAFCKLT
jgi:hypothetical protein